MIDREPAEVARAFAPEGRVVEIRPHGSGHIHDTFVSTVELDRGRIERFLHQKINRAVLSSPERVMENIERVTAHLKLKIADEGGDPDRDTLTIVRTAAGGALHTAESGAVWRTFRFVEGARSHDAALGPAHVHEAARAFGRFVRRLADLGPPPLHVTIPRFADPAWRHEELLRAIEADTRGRVRDVGDELRFLERRARLVDDARELFADGALPDRVVHHDTKINNVLIDDATGRAVAVVDLDTTMTGRVLYDYGDLVRTAASTSAEDEPDPARVGIDRERLEAIRHGYLEGVSGLLTADEVEALDRAGPIVTLTIGMRFLADFLSGDRYFKVRRAGQNLDRCRAHFALVDRLLG